MIKLNDNSIFVGEIKQLLKNFNLPNCPIGSENARANKHYIDGNSIFLCTSETVGGKESLVSTRVSEYIYGHKYLNLTKNFIVDNMIYDKDTHRYLGKYLRFLRDYKNINLMSMYNCFDSEVNSTSIAFEIGGKSITFEGIEDDSIVYSIPITKDAITIATSEAVLLEMCASVDINNSSVSSIIDKLGALTYQKEYVSNKILYTKLNDLTNGYVLSEAVVGSARVGTARIYTNTKSVETLQCINILNRYYNDIRLLIKVPKAYTKAIIVLEGDFTSSIGKYFTYLYDNVERETEFMINPQLISHENMKVNYLLADKLVEYLTGNAITPISDDYDIKKTQKYLLSHDYVSSDYLGVWSNEDTIGMKKFISDNDLQSKYDMLPYLDKKTEALTKGEIV